MHERTVHVKYSNILHETDTQRFKRMTMPMTYFMGQHCDYFIMFELKQKTLVYGYEMVSANTHVLGSMRAVLPQLAYFYLDISSWKSGFTGEMFDLETQVLIFDAFEFIEVYCH